ncbi:MAG: non-ribosomal peptide synthetase, partial [Myxococcaceae bacterium]
LYRTGDKARWRDDGSLEFLGRDDNQVKLRGFRIELGEVEGALRLLAHEVAVVVREDSPGDKRLVAYLVAPGADAAVLKSALRAKIPEYMLPSALVLLDALPLSPNGKVDRKALPAPELLASSPSAFAEPRTATEVTLAALFSDVLHLPRVGLHDDFFELGGHSLLATQLVSRVRGAFRVELALRELFEAPSVERLALRLQSLLATQQGHALVPALARAPRDQALPLSFAQQRLWFLDQLEPGSTAYNIPGALRLTGALDVACLQHAFTELVRRHEALRTCFREADGQPTQVISPPAPFALPVTDLSAHEDGEVEARRLAEQDACEPFDLAQGPMLRASLLRMGAHAHVLLINMHHVVSDGWSMGVLVREVAALYEAFSSGRPSPLSELLVQYADYAVWQRAWLQGPVLETQILWWKQHLEGAPATLELPTDKPRPTTQSHRGASCPVHLPRDLSDALKALCQREGVTPFMALLAAWQLLLSRYSGQEDITVGSPIAGRRVVELEGLIGFFVNTLALRTRLEGNPSFRQTLARVKESTLGAFAHQDLPFEKLVEELQPPRILGRSPLFQVLFALQNAPTARLALPNLTLDLLSIESATANFELELNLSEDSEGFAGTLTYRQDLFTLAFAQRLSRHFVTLVEALVAQPERPFHLLPLLSSEERQTV